MKKVSRFFMLILFGAAAVLFAAAYKENKPYVKERKENLKLQDLVLEQKSTHGEPEEEKKIDFDILKRINPDICGWLYISGTNINYPILIGKTDEEYLKRNFKGEYSSLGSVFTFSDMEKDFSDAHICIFAHNMKKPQMFGELKRYREREFSKEHGQLYLYTPGKTEKYQLFSVFECEKGDEIFQHKMKQGSQEFYKLVKDIHEKNMLISRREGENIGIVEKLITLSTCSEFERTKNRWTVHFAKIEEN